MSSTSECDVKLFDSFLKIGCCQTCCLRLLGESNPAIYQNVTQHVKHVGFFINFFNSRSNWERRLGNNSYFNLRKDTL